MKDIKITTSRLSLVTVDVEHVGDIFVNFTSQVAKYMTPQPACDISQTEQLVAIFKLQRKNGTDYNFAITLKGAGEFIGLCGVHMSKDGNNASVGIWTKQDSHGNHYGREAILGLLGYCNSVLKLTEVIYDVDERNIPSKKIPLSLGGKHIGDKREVNAVGFELHLQSYLIDLIKCKLAGQI